MDPRRGSTTLYNQPTGPKAISTTPSALQYRCLAIGRKVPGSVLEARPAVIAGVLAWLGAGRLGRLALRTAALIAAVILLLLACRRSGERLGRMAERLEASERTNDVQREMLEAAARRPRDRGDLAGRLREGRF
jgi:hypothetical protein